jgi:hypothetical protein
MSQTVGIGALVAILGALVALVFLPARPEPSTEVLPAGSAELELDVAA